ncbi:MAG TPA: nitroreductase/quinone reductase family protein [Ktedonobacterales bacterium]|nr:nitroreductase/quinone reductase family protein [Ktedonobacterales bacterium]
MSKKQAGGERESGHFGSAPLGVWVIKHIFSPLDRHLYRWTGGRGIGLGRPLAPRLLLTTTGRFTGQARTIPVFYLREDNRLIICNVNPGFEHPNPWMLNLRAHPVACVRIGSMSGTYHAREATDEEVARYWPRLVHIWPAYQTHYDRSGQRSIFILEPT